LTSLLSETPASAADAVAQPYASYWHPATIRDWDPATDRDARYNRSTVPLARRVVPARPANAHAHTGEARVQASLELKARVAGTLGANDPLLTGRAVPGLRKRRPTPPM